MLTGQYGSITEVNVVPVKPDNGLVAFASIVLDYSVYLGSIGVHRLIDGSGYRITYPTHKIGKTQLNYFHPINKVLHQHIEESIIEKCIEVFEKSDERNDRHNKTSNKGY